jgi:glycosyltransferase involved in cell wall biosynthesis
VRIALVHDWLITLGGSDRVLLALHEMFPDAPVYASLYAPQRLPSAFREMQVRTTWLQSVPGAINRHRALVPLMPMAFRSLNLREFDVVLSSSHACAKGVRVGPGAMHICYCHTPMRYAWDFDGAYVSAMSPMARPAARAALSGLREWDPASARRVDHFIANSRFVADRIRRHYGRLATVIHPPVDVEFFTPEEPSVRHGGEFFLIVSRLVPYKRVDLAVEAFNLLGLPLVIVGDGPEATSLRARARANVQFAGEVSDEELRDHYRRCRALVFPGEEDFGIVPVEAQACGRPVIAYARGGALETILAEQTGIFFNAQTVEALAAAVQSFESAAFDSEFIRRHAERFSGQRFHTEIAAFVNHATANNGEAPWSKQREFTLPSRFAERAGKHQLSWLPRQPR